MKFNFNGSSLGLTQADVEKAEAGGGGSSKYMGPGVHSVKITQAEYNGGKSGSITCEGDPTWVKLHVTLENPAGQTKKQVVIVPTSKLTYTTKNGKETAFMFVKFKQFIEGLGEAVTPDAECMARIAKKFLSDPTKMIGKSMEITIAYTGAYLEYVGKDGDQAAYAIMSKEGEIVESGPLTKPAAQLEAAKRKLTLVDFPEITEIVSKVKKEVVKEVKEPIKEEDW